MMVTRLEEMKGQQWEKGWIDGGGRTHGLPQNLSGRRYSGHNDFFLQLHTAANGYDVPVYATYKQIREAGATVGKGEKAMPVIYWNHDQGRAGEGQDHPHYDGLLCLEPAADQLP